MPALPRASAMTRPTRVPAPVTRATRPSSSTSRSSLARPGSSCRQSLVLFFQPLERDVHYTESTRTFRCAVPVGPAALHQAEEICQSQEALHVFRRMAGMPYLDAVETRGDQRFEPFPPSAVARMRPHRQCPRLVRDSNCILDGQASLRHESAAVDAKVSYKSISKVGNHSACDQGARDVRPSHGATVGLLKNFVERQPDAKGIQFLNDSFRTRVAQRAQIAEPLFQ